MAAVPYLAHFSLPFLFVTYLLKVDGKPFLFLWYFGLLNFTGVMTHMIFPTAPPWYNARFGIEPATYDIPGDPGRLKRADEILEVPLFESIYGNSPLVFGSFPSLHAGWPFLICIYTTIFKLPFLHRFVKWGYVCWVWWAALYLKHHFMLDVLGGAVYALICIYISDKYIVNRFFYCPTETELEARKKEKDLPADVEEHWEVVDV
jgi:membrane-associated phospholipid phosphatase